MSDTKEAVVFAFDKLEKYFDVVSQVVEKYAPAAGDIGLSALRVEALSIVVVPLFWLVVLSIMTYIAWKKLPFAYKEGPSEADFEKAKSGVAKNFGSRLGEEDVAIRKVFGRCSSAVAKGTPMPAMEASKVEAIDFDSGITFVKLMITGIFISLTLVSAASLIDVWAWVGVFYPELYAVHKLMG